MGVSEKLTRRPFGPEDGVALPVALFGIILVAVLGAGIWVSTSISARSVENRKTSTEAVQLAEAGAAHAIHVLRDHLDNENFTSILRGDDGTAGTSDDGLLVGYGLSSELEIPASGRALGDGTYKVEVIDDPAELDGDPTTDTNKRVLIRSSATTSRSGSATIDVVLNDGPNAFVPSIVTDGPLLVEGNPRLIGSCGGIHSNLQTDVTGDVTVSTEVASSDTVIVSGSITRPDGTTVAPRHHETQVEVTDYSNPYNEFCSSGEADYVLQSDGYVLETSTGTLYDARTQKQFGWQQVDTGPIEWELGGSTGYPGTYCVQGNAEIAGSPDDGSGGALDMTVIATKSIDVSGNPQIRSSHPQDILLVAGSDLRISGNVLGDPGDYTGLIYARAQCDLHGNAQISSRVLCKNANNASGAYNLIDGNAIGGNVELDYDCAATTGVSGPREAVSWSQRVGE